jgi:SAM-dependent methyltransferase
VVEITDLPIWRKELLNGSRILAERQGIESMHREYYKHPYEGAGAAIERLSDSIAKQCGEEVYGVYDGPHEEGSKRDIHLMSNSTYLWMLFPKTAYHFPEYTSFLDLGCGSGYPVNIGLKLGYDCYGVDKDADIVEVAKRNVSWYGGNPERIVHGDYLNDSFWETPICGKLPGDFDMYYLYNNWEGVFDALPKIAERVRKGKHIVLEFWETLEANEDIVREYGLEWEGLEGFFAFLRKTSDS